MSESEYNIILSVMAQEVDMLRFRIKAAEEENDRLCKRIAELEAAK